MIYSSPPSTAASTCAAAYTQPGSVISKDDHKLPTLPGDARWFPCLVICCVFYRHAQQQGSVEGGQVAKSLQGWRKEESFRVRRAQNHVGSACALGMGLTGQFLCVSPLWEGKEFVSAPGNGLDTSLSSGKVLKFSSMAPPCHSPPFWCHETSPTPDPT